MTFCRHKHALCNDKNCCRWNCGLVAGTSNARKLAGCSRRGLQRAVSADFRNGAGKTARGEVEGRSVDFSDSRPPTYVRSGLRPITQVTQRRQALGTDDAFIVLNGLLWLRYIINLKALESDDVCIVLNGLHWLRYFIIYCRLKVKMHLLFWMVCFDSNIFTGAWKWRCVYCFQWFASIQIYLKTRRQASQTFTLCLYVN